MFPSLTLNQLHNNCLVIYNCSHKNLLVDEEGTLSGFSNWLVPVKVLKMSVDWWTDYNRCRLIEWAVLNTLEAMGKQLADTQASQACPLFFVLDYDAYQKECIPRTYHQIITRLKNSHTLAGCETIQKKADEVLALYDSHPMGSSVEGVDEEGQQRLKGRLMKEVLAELKLKYSNDYSRSLLALNDAQQNLQAAFTHRVSLPTPPADRTDLKGLQDYLQKKVTFLQKEALGSLSPQSYS